MDTPDNKNIIDFLSNPEKLYLASKTDKARLNDIDNLPPMELALCQIEEISFEDKAPRKEALENVLSAMKIEGINFIYLILGDATGVHFYYGVAKDLSYRGQEDLSVYDIGQCILEPSIRGNFRGSKVKRVSPEDKDSILAKIQSMKYCSMLEGVPGSNKDDEKFQGVDRLVDVMLGDNFGFMIIAKPLNSDQISNIEKDLYDAYEKLTPLCKESCQDGKSQNRGSSKSETKGTSQTEGESLAKTTQQSHTNTDGRTKSDSAGTSRSSSENKNTSKTTTDSTTIQKSSSKTKGNNHTKGFSSSKSTNNSIGDKKSTSESGGESTSDTRTDSATETNGGSTTKGISQVTGDSESTTTGTSSNITTGTSHSRGSTEGESHTSGQNHGTSSSNSTSMSKNSSEGTSHSVTKEFVRKRVQEWLKYLDDIILPRLDYGAGKGIFVTTSALFSDKPANLKKLENTAISLYSGEQGNKVPLKAQKDRTGQEKIWKMLKNMQIPSWKVKNNDIDQHEQIWRSALSQFVSETEIHLGNWITTNELSMIAGLPQKEVVGLGLKEEVEFGLNLPSDGEIENQIELGNLIQSGNVMKNIKVNLDKENMDKHIFITGVTGSGKTTTCQKILIDSDLPFLVIEPAKTEYRILSRDYPDLLVFTLGRDDFTPFRLNPFEFLPHESISARVDMVMASIQAAFDMEAAIPQIIETAMYRCYEDKGWNVASSKNRLVEDPFSGTENVFPTLSDLLCKIDTVVKGQGFDDRLKNDYIGSIKARLQGLLVGSKGFMLNTEHSVDFRKLLDKKVVLELEEIRNTGEKSLIMGFILTNLAEAIKAKYHEDRDYKHITLVEEAHRLLSKFTPGDSPNQKQGVETFTDMLAEIRKYGESLVIVDQIPNKLTPEILKNTNTKIVHRIFAQDDKDAIGNTIALGKEQKEFLSYLETGRAIVFTEGFNKAIQVQVDKTTDTTEGEPASDKVLKNSVYQLYADLYRQNIVKGSIALEKKPEPEVIEIIFDLSRIDLLREIFQLKGKWDRKISKELKQYILHIPAKTLAKVILLQSEHNVIGNEEVTLKVLEEFLISYSDRELSNSEMLAYRENQDIYNLISK